MAWVFGALLQMFGGKRLVGLIFALLARVYMISMFASNVGIS